MKIRLLIAALAAACMAAFNGCGPEPLAGGTIETTNGITARVVLPSGKPASNIKLFLLDEQDWLKKTKAGESIVVDSTETNDSGTFKFKFKTPEDSARTVSLYADVETYGLLTHACTQKLVDDAYKRTIGMSKKVSYQGTINDSTYVTEKLFLAGTPFSSEVDGAGKFIIKDVPQEYYSVVILRKLPNEAHEYVVGEKVKLDEWTEGKPDIITPDTTKAVLVEDFEDLDNRNLLGPILGGGWWDALNDFPADNSTLLQPVNAAPQNFTRAITNGGSDERARSLHVLYKAARAVPTAEPFVMLMTDLGAGRVHYNLSGMDSLTFFSGGSGRLTVEFVQQNPAGAEPGSEVALQVIASKTIVLDSAGWTKFSIKPADLKISVGWFPTDPANFKAAFEKARLPAYTKRPGTWQEMGGMVTQIRFKGAGGIEFWLDHIRIHGITAGDLVK